MTLGDWVDILVAGTDSDAADAVAEIRQSSTGSPRRLDLLERLGTTFASSSLMSKRTQATRLRLALLALRPTEEEFLRLTGAAPDLPAHLRVTVAEVVPARLQHQIYGARDGTEAPKDPWRGARPLASAATASPPEHQDLDRTVQVPTSRAALSTSQSSPGPVFVLVSHADYQEPNRNLLQKELDLDVVTIDSMEALATLLQADVAVCGYAIDESVLRTLDETDQRELVTIVAEYSTFAPIRIHDPALLLEQHEVQGIIKDCRRLQTPVPWEALTFESDRTIRSAELRRYELSADLQRADARAFFVFEDVSEHEAKLLAAAVRTKLLEQRIGSDPMPEVARIRFLAGGRSDARLLSISTPGYPTLVAKVTSKASARDEVQRCRVFMRQWELHLKPQCYYHGNTGVILSALVRDGADASGPAQPLEVVLEELWNREFMGADGAILDGEAKLVALALRNAARGLAELNKQDPPSADDLPAFVDAPGTHLNNLEQQGLDFGMDEDAVRALRLSAERRREFRQQAVVHGDVHLRNALRRGNTEVQWIDFASTALGHPAIDLVRLEMALYLGPMRQFADFDACVAFQHLFTVERASLEVLMEKCPEHFSCCINRACVEGMIESRDQVLEVVRHHGGDARDYLATKLLLAWHHLGRIGSNTGMARAVVTAIAPEISE